MTGTAVKKEKPKRIGKIGNDVKGWREEFRLVRRSAEEELLLGRISKHASKGVFETDLDVVNGEGGRRVIADEI